MGRWLLDLELLGDARARPGDDISARGGAGAAAPSEEWRGRGAQQGLSSQQPGGGGGAPSLPCCKAPVSSSVSAAARPGDLAAISTEIAAEMSATRQGVAMDAGVASSEGVPRLATREVVPLAIVKEESQLNWPERRRLNAVRSMFRRAPSESDAGSGSASQPNSGAVAMAAASQGDARQATSSADSSASGTDHEAWVPQVSPTREAALWRTLRGTGLISSSAAEQGV